MTETDTTASIGAIQGSRMRALLGMVTFQNKPERRYIT